MKKTFCFYAFAVLLLSFQYISSQSLWQPTTLNNAPAPRNGHTAVWTGNSMIIWGGQNYPYTYRSGAILDTLNNWTPVDSSNAPIARKHHSAVWTGNKMIIWGGNDSTTEYYSFLNSGGIYDPASNTWISVSLTDAPAARFAHTATWTGDKMIIWGGYNGEYLNTGGIYDPVTDSWSEISTVNAPCEREHHTAIWTGSRLIIWGGNIGYGEGFSCGGVYDPVTDTWIAMDTVNAPSARFFHTAVWTGSKMIVWGGAYTSAEIPLMSGGIYDPVTNTWAALDSVNAPEPRSLHSAIWTGSKMLVWGGWQTLTEYFRTGGIYDPVNNTWEETDTLNAPTPRLDHKAVWTGNKMIIWGGFNPNIESSLNTGGIYRMDNLTAINNVNSIIKNYRLSQNYPNPFNPVTTINYDILKAGKIFLGIYDILGREVAVLVNEAKNKGAHSVKWDASLLASGVYFYRINAGEFTEIKKMILIK